jgi:hypothetical protein
VESLSQIRFVMVRSLVARRLPLHTRRLATQTVNALREHHDSRATDVYSKVQVFFVESVLKAQNTSSDVRRGASIKKNGGRRGDVKPDTLKKCLDEFPTHFLKIIGGHLLCESCSRNVGSSSSAVKCHIVTGAQYDTA